MGTVSRLLSVANFSVEDRVLDIGGGTGAVGRGIKNYVRDVVVLDVAEGMVAICKKHDGGITWSLNPLTWTVHNCTYEKICTTYQRRKN